MNNNKPVETQPLWKSHPISNGGSLLPELIYKNQEMSAILAACIITFCVWVSCRYFTRNTPNNNHPQPNLPSPAASSPEVATELTPLLTMNINNTRNYLIASNELKIDYKNHLSTGGLNVIYQGTWSMRQVAIKKLYATRLSEEELTSFKKEATLHASLLHPNIVTLWGVCIEPGKYSMVTELMEKGTLYEVLHNSRCNNELPWPMRLKIAEDIAKGLNYLHEQKPPIIHRDLKSQSILLNRHNEAKLANFSLSKEKNDASVTTDSFIETLYWIAPELFVNQPHYNTKTDIYALGIVFWEITSRQLPYQNISEVTHYVASGGREKIPTDTPPKFAQLIAQCWAQRAEYRPSAKSVAGELIFLTKFST